MPDCSESICASFNLRSALQQQSLLYQPALLVRVWAALMQQLELLQDPSHSLSNLCNHHLSPSCVASDFGVPFGIRSHGNYDHGL